MLEVLRMPSSAATDGLRCESYRTTPRVLSDDEDAVKLRRESEVDTDRVQGDAEIARQRDGIRSAPPSHFSTQLCESLTEKLLEHSEQRSLDDTLVFESSVFDDWCEAASGWRHVVPYPKYVNKPNPNNKVESVQKKQSSGRRVSVRCVDDDFASDPLCPSWKANVEPVTYRYIPNNGCYRINKSTSRDPREWLAALRKTRSERVLVTPEVRQTQRTLKKDLDSHFKGGAEPVMEQRSEPSVSDKPSTEQVSLFSSKRLAPREQLMVKSASDLFMENFNSRLSALEKEIQTSYPAVQSKKPPDTTSSVNPATVSFRQKIKEARQPVTPKASIQSTQAGSPNISEDLFTVIPIMGKPEIPLRPLEKLTPKQKQMEQNFDVSFDEPQSPSDTQGDDTNIILASATSQPQSSQRDSDSNQGINTARSAIAMTNFDIEKMRMRPPLERHVPLRSDFHKSRSFLVPQGHGLPPSGRRGAMRYAHTRDLDQASISTVAEESVMGDMRAPGRIQEKQLDPVSGGLPEIMGKRLSVTLTSHRLL